MKQTCNFTIDKECKHSRRYAATDESFPIKTVYVDREVARDNDHLIISITDIRGEVDREEER